MGGSEAERWPVFQVAQKGQVGWRVNAVGAKKMKLGRTTYRVVIG